MFCFRCCQGPHAIPGHVSDAETHVSSPGAGEEVSGQSGVQGSLPLPTRARHWGFFSAHQKHLAESSSSRPPPLLPFFFSPEYLGHDHPLTQRHTVRPFDELSTCSETPLWPQAGGGWQGAPRSPASRAAKLEPQGSRSQVCAPSQATPLPGKGGAPFGSPESPAHTPEADL